MTNTPAGWYPQEDGRQRYWDGAQWTEHFAPGANQVTQQGVAAPAASQAGTPSSARPWFKKKRYLIPSAVVGLFVLGSALGSLGSADPTKPAALTSSSSPAASTAPKSSSPTKAEAAPSPSPSATATPAPKPSAKPKPAAPALSAEQENAKGSAESYLEMSGFSKKGLIDQLKFEGYKSKDIDAALATMKVDWNAEAAESAKDYLAMTHFSRSGLIDQLEFEGYTAKQAAYGVKAAGL